jgi:hypothetical protein
MLPDMARFPLPPEIHGLAIRTSTAEDHGLTRKRLRAPDVQHPFYGVSAVGLDLGTVRDRALAFLPAMEPGQAFSHTTALALHGAPLPVLPPDLHVSVAFPRTPPRRVGIRGHSITGVPTVLLDAMPVSPAEAAWAQSAALLSREDLVAVGDFLLFQQLGSTVALGATVDLWRGRPGHARLAWAVARVRPGVRSRPETILRLLLVRSRLPEPVVGYPVAVAGGLILHPDLSYPECKLALEYEGDGHRSRRQWELDIERRELLAEAGWRTLRITAAHLFRDPGGLVDRVRRHLAH